MGSGINGGGDSPPKSRGTDTPWYRGWDLSTQERAVFRKRSRASRLAKERALSGLGPKALHRVNTPRLNPDSLLPQLSANGLRSLSLFSGGGGLDLGFEKAGFEHVASYEILGVAADTLRRNRPAWQVFSDSDGDVRNVDWKRYRNKLDLVHGGPPCQPFSSAGRQLGKSDVRNMFPEFIRCVLECKPRAFVAENVPALSSRKFALYVQNVIIKPLSPAYTVTQFVVSAESMGVPQVRRRVIFVGFRSKRAAASYQPPEATHDPLKGDDQQADLFATPKRLPRCMGTREALGLPDIGVDALAPTLRSGFTGPRHTTSVLSSVSAQRSWEFLQIWPNGVAMTREAASLFVAKNGHFRLSVADCALLQGFPRDWPFHGPVYASLGQIGNSVAPPVAYAVAKSVARALKS